MCAAVVTEILASRNPGRIDYVDDVAGPALSLDRMASETQASSFVEATSLRPVNLVAAIKDVRLQPLVRQQFSKPLWQQRQDLIRVLSRTQRFPKRVVAAIARTPRDLILPARAACLSYCNGANLVSGTLAIPSPWMAAYVAACLRITAGARVLVFGFGAGFTSLIFSELVGPEGQVVAVELDSAVIGPGRDLLQAVGNTNISIVQGDALAARQEQYGRFDCIFSSLASREVPDRWLELLRDDGRIAAFVPDAVTSEREHGSPGSWWGDLRLVTLAASCDVVWHASMEGVVNAPFIETDDVDDGRPGLYQQFPHDEDELLAFVASRD